MDRPRIITALGGHVISAAKQKQNAFLRSRGSINVVGHGRVRARRRVGPRSMFSCTLSASGTASIPAASDEATSREDAPGPRMRRPATKRQGEVAPSAAAPGEAARSEASDEARARRPPERGNLEQGCLERGRLE